MTDVLVVAELIDGGLRKTTLSAISAARTIASGTGGAFDVLAIGVGAKKAAGEVAGFGARKVLATEVAGGYLAEGYAATVAAAAKSYGVVVVTASTYGKDLLPRVAGKLNAGMHNIVAMVAQSPNELQTGLMHRKTMATNEGMLFVFPFDSTQCFWMKNTLLPLSAAFVELDGTVVNIADMKPKTETSHCSVKPVRFVLEMNDGWFAKRGIKPGFKLGGKPFAR